MEGVTKVCLKVKTEQELEDVYAKAIELKIPTSLIVDAGRTQIAAGSKTV